MRVLSFAARGRTLDGAHARLLDARQGRWMRLSLTDCQRFDRQVSGAGFVVFLAIFGAAFGLASLEAGLENGHWHLAAEWADKLQPLAVGLIVWLALAVNHRRARRLLLERGQPVVGPVRPDLPSTGLYLKIVLGVMAALLIALVAWAARSGDLFELWLSSILVASMAVFVPWESVRRRRLRALVAAFDAEHGAPGDGSGMLEPVTAPSTGQRLLQWGLVAACAGWALWLGLGGHSSEAIVVALPGLLIGAKLFLKRRDDVRRCAGA